MIDNNTVLRNSDLYFNKPLERWDEGIPLGNGLMGCIIWGNGNPLRMGLDRGDLWDLRPATETLSPGYNYKELIKLVEKKDQEAITQKFDAFYFKPEPTKIPAGALEINFGNAGCKMKSHLSLSNALCSIDFDFDGQQSSVKTFLHATTHAGFIRVTGNAGIPDIKPLPPNQWGSMKKPEFVTFNPHSFDVLGYPPAMTGEEGKISWFHQKTCEELEYAVIIAQETREDVALEAVYLIASSVDGKGWMENAKKRSMELLTAGFENALTTHSQWWEQYWLKSSIGKDTCVIGCIKT